jgi:LysM repeat protein
VKRNPNAPLWLALFSAILLLSLAACVRPTPQPEGVEVQQPEVIPEQPADPLPPLPPPMEPLPGYPGPVEGDESGETQPTDNGEVVETTEPPAEPPADVPTSHTVQAGETLAGIARQYNLTTDELAAANNLTNVNQLVVGQVLVIPAPGSVAQPPPTTDTPGLTPGDQVHIVQAGENLFRISLRYGFTVQELASYNNIPDPSRIYVGQVIRIPPR